jgi:hypothetical protein
VEVDLFFLVFECANMALELFTFHSPGLIAWNAEHEKLQIAVSKGDRQKKYLKSDKDLFCLTFINEQIAHNGRGFKIL